MKTSIIISVIVALFVISASPALSQKIPKQDSPVKEILLFLEAGQTQIKSSEPKTYYSEVATPEIRFRWDYFVPSEALLAKLAKNPNWNSNNSGKAPGEVARYAAPGDYSVSLSASDPIIGEVDNYCRGAGVTWKLQIFEIGSKMNTQKEMAIAIAKKKAVFEKQAAGFELIMNNDLEGKKLSNGKYYIARVTGSDGARITNCIGFKFLGATPVRKRGN
jgi:hypothetical protein